MAKYKSSKTQETHSRGNTADMGIGNKQLPLLPPPPVKSWIPPSGVASFRPCRPRPTLFQKVKKYKRQKCNKMEGGGGRG